MIKNKIKYFLIFSISIFSLACSNSDLEENPNFADSEIFGNWADTVQLQPQGYVIYSLVFRPNGAFEANNDKFGLYTVQAMDSLSAYRHDFGNFVLSTKNIYFISKQSISWDLMSNKLPETTIKDSTLFLSCTYKIQNNKLELKYIDIQNKQEKQVIHTYQKVRDIL